MKNKNHVITRTNRAECGAVCQNDRLSAGHIWQTRSHVYGEVKCQTEIQSDIVILNKFGNGETCLGLLRRFVHKIANSNEISPHNDMNNNIVTNLFSYFPIPKKLRRFRIKSGMTFMKQPAFTLAEGATHVDLPPTKVKFAFTLAEVLITLGIIGIVAAMTIPGLQAHYKAKRMRSQFLKSYSLVQQAFKQMEADDVSLDPSTYPSRTFYKTYMNYFTGVTDCGFAGEKCSGAAGTHYKGLDGTNGSISEDGRYSIFDDGQFLLKDGTLIILENAYGGGSRNLWVHIDINGYNSPPNILGYDLFTFQMVDGELRTMGDTGTMYEDLEQYCNFDSKTKFNGIACAQMARTDSTYFERLIKKYK